MSPPFDEETLCASLVSGPGPCLFLLEGSILSPSSNAGGGMSSRPRENDGDDESDSTLLRLEVCFSSTFCTTPFSQHSSKLGGGGSFSRPRENEGDPNCAIGEKEKRAARARRTSLALGVPPCDDDAIV